MSGTLSKVKAKVEDYRYSATYYAELDERYRQKFRDSNCQVEVFYRLSQEYQSVAVVYNKIVSELESILNDRSGNTGEDIVALQGAESFSAGKVGG